MILNKKFGKAPDAGRRSRFNTLANYKNGQFQNLVPTPPLVEGASMMKVLWNFLVKHPDTRPNILIPAVHTDLKSMPVHENALVWA